MSFRCTYVSQLLHTVDQLRRTAVAQGQSALDQGRDVFVVPGNIDVDTSAGSNRLLRDGAIAVSSGWDILSEYEQQFPQKVRKFDAPLCRSAEGQQDEKILDFIENGTYTVKYLY